MILDRFLYFGSVCVIEGSVLVVVNVIGFIDSKLSMFVGESAGELALTLCIMLGYSVITQVYWLFNVLIGHFYARSAEEVQAEVERLFRSCGISLDDDDDDDEDKKKHNRPKPDVKRLVSDDDAYVSDLEVDDYQILSDEPQESATEDDSPQNLDGEEKSRSRVNWPLVRFILAICYAVTIMWLREQLLLRISL